jgi:hypothetical protein
VTFYNPDHYPGRDDRFPDHPYAALLPLMGGEEFDRLVESIKLFGQLNPIILYRGQILDGRNRYRAIAFINLEIKPKHLIRLRYGYFERGHENESTDKLAFEFVRANNFCRRSLSPNFKFPEEICSFQRA